MSNSGENNKDLVQEVDEMRVKAESWWDKNGAKALAIGGIVLGLFLNKKINRLEARTGNAFKGVEKSFNQLSDHVDCNFEGIFNNFKMLRADIVDVATSTGYTGKLRVNHVKVED